MEERKSYPKPISFLKGSDIVRRAEIAEAKRESQGDYSEAVKIVFGTSGEFPDGTPWERDATPEEEEKYREYME